MKNLLNSVACFFAGHKPTRMLIETDISIHTRGCARCGCALGLPAMWKTFNKIYPPGYDKEQRDEYDLYIERKMQKLRDTCKTSQNQ